MTRIAFSCSAASWVRAWTRRARDRSAVTVLRVSTSQSVRVRSREARAIHGGQLVPTEPVPDVLGGGDDQAEHLTLGVGGGLHRRASRGQQHRQRLPVTARTWGAQPGPR